VITAASFRVDFPEFGSIVTFPTSVINYYLALAALLLNKSRFGQPSATVSNPPTTMYDMATELFVAHFITLERNAMQTTQSGGVPGAVQGPTTSKSVGPVSISFDSQAVIEPDAGHWNLTMYGLRFMSLVNMFGAGPVQIGVGCTPWWVGGAWPGPLMPSWPGWS
jgi:hypothetical protein